MKKDFLSILDISKPELGQILDEAAHLKKTQERGHRSRAASGAKTSP